MAPVFANVQFGGKMKIKLADGLPCHPRTGVRALAVLRNVPVWPVLGASDDDDNDSGGTDDDADADDDAGGEDDTDNAKEKAGKDDKNKSSKKSGPAKTIVELEEENRQLRKRMSAADRNKTEAQKKVEELERKERTDLENAQNDLQKATDRNTVLEKELKTLRLGNAFHSASGRAEVAWHDPEVALKTLDLEGVEIDDEGNVTGMDAAVKKLAKARPFLVNKGKATEDDGDKDKDGKGKQKSGPTGSGVGSGSNGGKGKPAAMSDEEARRRFPALR